VDWVKVFGVHRPLRSLSLAVLILPVAERLGEETFAATEWAERERAAVAISQRNGIDRTTKYRMGTVLHNVGNVADLYSASIDADFAVPGEALASER
jgi:hypothetical protein